MCFSLDWLRQILILAVVIAGVVMILQLLIPYLVGRLGVTLGAGWAVVVGAFRILLWAVVTILIIIICFDIIGCLLSFSGGVSLLPHR